MKHKRHKSSKHKGGLKEHIKSFKKAKHKGVRKGGRKHK